VKLVSNLIELIEKTAGGGLGNVGEQGAGEFVALALDQDPDVLRVEQVWHVNFFGSDDLERAMSVLETTVCDQDLVSKLVVPVNLIINFEQFFVQGYLIVLHGESVSSTS
jgi:hypothetical protein